MEITDSRTVAINKVITRARERLLKAQGDHGPFASHHEVYGVLAEELHEYLDSIHKHTPDPEELIDIASAALRAAVQAIHEGIADK